MKNQINPDPSAQLLLKKIDILIELNRAVSRSLKLQDSLNACLKILQDSYDIHSGAVFIKDKDKDSIRLVASIGIKEPTQKERRKLSGGLTNKVVNTGKPVVVPQVSKEPLFLNRFQTWNKTEDGELSFLSVPIALDYKTYGALSICLPFQEKRDYETTLNFFFLVASALLQPIRVADVIAAERKKLIDENTILKHKLEEKFSFNNIIGNSHEMREALEKVSRVAKADTSVLLRGESGTGKELFAEAIHYNSSRKKKPFIRVNCAAIPENLIESEFFGYEKGAFTGAEKRKPGRFEIANGGTIFLDEIGDLSLQAQIKLLRVLQEKQFERVGGNQTIDVDIRIIAATNANLEELIEQGSFREELYYRLNVFPIYLPSLRERKTDISLLADNFMLEFAKKHKKPIKRISTPAIDMLMSYHWPGNVRELKNCIERAVLVCEDQVIHSFHLPPTLQTAESSNTQTKMSLDDAVASYEREIIQDTLKSTNGNQAQAARLLDSTARIIGYKIDKYNIDVERFKS